MITKSQITDIKSLKEKSSRTQLSMFVAEGEKIFEEIYGSIFFIKQIFFVADKISNINFERVNALKQKKCCEIVEISPKEMERITHFKTPTTILACVAIPDHKFSLDSGKLILALDNIQDPGNLGTIVRIADWFGIEDVICSPTSADVYNPKVVQATMGAIARVRVHYLPLDEVLCDAPMPVYGTFLNGDNIYSKELPKGSGAIVVMGNEGSGISPEIESLVTERLFIPPYPVGRDTSESLNVAVATSIICNEFRRGL